MFSCVCECVCLHRKLWIDVCADNKGEARSGADGGGGGRAAGTEIVHILRVHCNRSSLLRSSGSSSSVYIIVYPHEDGKSFIKHRRGLVLLIPHQLQWQLINYYLLPILYFPSIIVCTILMKLCVLCGIYLCTCQNSSIEINKFKKWTVKIMLSILYRESMRRLLNMASVILEDK